MFEYYVATFSGSGDETKFCECFFKLLRFYLREFGHRVRRSGTRVGHLFVLW